MTRRRLVTMLAFSAILLIPLIVFLQRPAADDSGRLGQTAERAPDPRQERHYKTEAVNRDRLATARLNTEALRADLAGLMARRRDGESGSAAGGRMDKLMRRRPQVTALLSVASPRSGTRIERGKLPEDTQHALAAGIEAAQAAIRDGQSYDSGETLAAGRRYRVLGVPDAARRSAGMIGVVREDVLVDVERDQRRNMRLTPYPVEGRYRTESAETGSLRDTTVRDGEDNQRVSHYHVDEVVVRFKTEPGRQTLNAMSREVGAISVRKLGYTYVFRSTRMDAKAMIAYFKRRWDPAYVEPHYLYLTNELTDAEPIVPNDALYAEYQWNLGSIGAERGWNVSKGSTGVIVGIVDTGVQLDHPDLEGKLLDGLNVIDKSAPPEDDVGHGTHVAGIIAADVNNGLGIAGLSWYNRILPVKALDDTGAGSTYSVAEGIIWATDNGAKVINLSLGNYASAAFLHDAVKYAYDHDVVVIAASGNDNTDKPGYPAAYPEVFAVAATDRNSDRASFSNYGGYIDAAAPGDSIPSTYTDSQYAALSGTSMASPHVAALAALIRSVNPELTAKEVMAVMRSSATDLGAPGRDDEFGEGQINIAQALEAAAQSSVSLQNFSGRLDKRLAAIQARYGADSR